MSATGAAVASAVIAGGQFVSDLVGRSQAKKKYRKQKSAFQNLLAQQTPFLQKGLLEARQWYGTSMDLLGDATEVKRQQRVQQYGQAIDKGQNIYGQSGMRTGSGEAAIQDISAEYQSQAAGDALRERESILGLQDKLKSRERDVAAAGYEMDATAAEYGIQTGLGASVYEGIRRPDDPALIDFTDMSGSERKQARETLLNPTFYNPYIS